MKKHIATLTFAKKDKKKNICTYFNITKFQKGYCKIKFSLSIIIKEIRAKNTPTKRGIHEPRIMDVDYGLLKFRFLLTGTPGIY